MLSVLAGESREGAAVGSRDINSEDIDSGDIDSGEISGA
jgi:hypothetical protein